MIINPFWAGVGACLIVEFLAVIIPLLWVTIKDRNKAKREEEKNGRN